jgi:hypothetical protein
VSVYVLSGTGIQALSSGVAQLSAVITTRSAPARDGNANPVNRFDQALFRFGNANGYRPSIPVDADTQLIDVPTGTTSLGYHVFHAGVVTVTEIFGAVGPTLANLIPMPQLVSVISELCLGVQLAALAATTQQSSNNPTSHIPLYPFKVTQPITLLEAMWENAGTVAGNIDVGVYDTGGNRLTHTGSTAQSGISTVQTAAMTSTLIQPGLYFIAFAASSGTGTTIQHALTNVRLRLTGIQQAASAFPLPSTISFAAPTTAANVIQCGVASVSTL